MNQCVGQYEHEQPLALFVTQSISQPLCPKTDIKLYWTINRNHPVTFSDNGSAPGRFLPPSRPHPPLPPVARREKKQTTNNKQHAGFNINSTKIQTSFDPSIGQTDSWRMYIFANKSHARQARQKLQQACYCSRPYFFVRWRAGCVHSATYATQEAPYVSRSLSRIWLPPGSMGRAEARVFLCSNSCTPPCATDERQQQLGLSIFHRSFSY